MFAKIILFSEIYLSDDVSLVNLVLVAREVFFDLDPLGRFFESGAQFVHFFFGEFDAVVSLRSVLVQLLHLVVQNFNERLKMARM